MKLEIVKESKESLIRESKTVRFTENDIEALVKAEVRRQFPNFEIKSFEVNCGMSQGSGFFEDISVDLYFERTEKTHK